MSLSILGSFAGQRLMRTASVLCSSAHERYFQLKKFSKQQREPFVEKRSAAYTS